MECIVKRSSFNELYHYGVSGQQWGVRRYENKDGTLTEEGRKHYGVGDKYHNADGSLTSKGYRERNKIEEWYRNTTGEKSFDAYRESEQKKGNIVGGAVGFATIGPLWGMPIGIILGGRTALKKVDKGRSFIESEIKRINNENRQIRKESKQISE